MHLLVSDVMNEDGPQSVSELLELLDLETLDRDLFRGQNPHHVDGGFSLYGGHVAAQALRAASLTVPDGRLPHSLHSYFLRPGRNDIPTILRVDRDRDGRSFSARRVTAIQEGEAIFTLSASFHVEADGPAYQVEIPPGTPTPDQLPPPPDRDGSPHFGMWDRRAVSAYETDWGWKIEDVYWARSIDRLPDDPVIHACALTHLSDLSTGMAKIAVEQRSGGPSLDHAVWFHRHIRLDDWVLFSMVPISAHAGRGLYSGTLHSANGTLGSTMIQECLMRTRPPGPPPGLPPS